MGIRQIAFLGYGITNFNYETDINSRITINISDKGEIKKYLKKHSL